MNERAEKMPAVPTESAASPFLFSARGRSDQDVVINSALKSAASAMTADPGCRDSRSRISFLLAELGSRNGQRTGDRSKWIPVNRVQLARAAKINLTKVKRVLGFFRLSGVVELGSEGVRILDWDRLCKLAGYSRDRTPVPQDEWMKSKAPAFPRKTEQPAPAVTASGDPASFV